MKKYTYTVTWHLPFRPWNDYVIGRNGSKRFTTERAAHDYVRKLSVTGVTIAGDQWYVPHDLQVKLVRSDGKKWSASTL